MKQNLWTPSSTVEDVDGHLARAREHGATILSEPTNQVYGEREHDAADPWDHRRRFCETLDDVHSASWGGV